MSQESLGFTEWTPLGENPRCVILERKESTDAKDTSREGKARGIIVGARGVGCPGPPRRAAGAGAGKKEAQGFISLEYALLYQAVGPVMGGSFGLIAKYVTQLTNAGHTTLFSVEGTQLCDWLCSCHACFLLY